MKLIDYVKLALSKQGASSKFSDIFKSITGTGAHVKPEGHSTAMPKVPKAPKPKVPSAPKPQLPVKSVVPNSMDGVDLMPDTSRARRAFPKVP